MKRRALLAALVCGLSLSLIVAEPAAATEGITTYHLDNPLPGGNSSFLMDSRGVSGYTVSPSRGVKPFMKLKGPVGWLITAGLAAWSAYSELDGLGIFGGPDAGHDTLTDWCKAGYCGASAYTPEATGNGVHMKLVGKDPTYKNRIDYVATCDMQYVDPQYAGVYGCGANQYDIRGFYATHTVSGSLDALVQCKHPDGTLSMESAQNTKGMPSSPPWTVSGNFTACPNSTWEVVGYRAASSTNEKGQPYGLGWGTLATPDTTIGWGSAGVDEECKNAKTGQVVHLTATVDLLANDNKIPLPSCKAHLGSDWYGNGLDVTPTNPYWDDPGTPVEHDPTPADWLKPVPGLSADDQPGQYQQGCNSTAKGCTLSVWVDGNPCSVGNPLCEVWDEIGDQDPSRVKCMWGVMELPLAMCAPLKEVYTPGTQVPLDPDPVPPDDDPGTGTGTGTSPTDPDIGDCMSQAWSWNPVDWVVVPVKCVVEWAFIPSESIDMDAVPIASWVVVPSFSDSCPVFSFSMAGHPLTIDICSGPLGSIKDTTRPITDAAVGFFAVLGAYRRVAAMFGAGDDDA